MKRDKIIVGITHGDINGIGYEVIIKSLQDSRVAEAFIPIIYGSPKVAGYHRKALNINNFSLNIINSAKEVNPKRANIINCIDENTRVELGKSTVQAGEAAFSSLELAVKDLEEGLIDVLVTAPINKYNIQQANFNFPGHTEYLCSKFKAKDVLMLMVSDLLKVGVVTGHLPLSKVPSEITLDTVLNKLRILDKSLQKDFAIRKPRIGVLGLNPHAGDNGILGKEEQDVIIPALETARKEGILAFGPFPADGFFGRGNFAKFDATLAMYHDQGLTPFKSIVYEQGVNYTAGLPVIRTSPAHGTAYEIAGKNEANEESFRHALFLACDIYKNREEHSKLTKNAMEKIDTSNI